MTRVLICGIAGYIGWNLAMYLARKDYEVRGFDNYFREAAVHNWGSNSLTPISTMPERIDVFEQIFAKDIKFERMDIRSQNELLILLYRFKPDVIIHLAEQPSAPYSMANMESAVSTQENNVIGSLKLLWAMKEVVPNAHLIKLGTMGEYGTPNIDIEEGYFEVEYKGRKAVLPFPKQPGSFYHATKVHDTVNISLACKFWGFRATDLMQGPVYGISTEENRADNRLLSRFDYDHVFGTVINRYCVQAVIGHHLSPYGLGFQKRGFINILDTLRCIELCIENPADEGQHRVFNQFFELFTVNELAEKVQAAAKKLDIDVEIKNIENPRIEKEEHYYNPSNKGLMNLGIKPHKLDDMLPQFIEDVKRFKERVRPDVIDPTVKWK